MSHPWGLWGSKLGQDKLMNKSLRRDTVGATTEMYRALWEGKGPRRTASSEGHLLAGTISYVRHFNSILFNPPQGGNQSQRRVTRKAAELGFRSRSVGFSSPLAFLCASGQLWGDLMWGSGNGRETSRINESLSEQSKIIKKQK